MQLKDLKALFPKKIGTDFIFKLSGMGENIVLGLFGLTCKICKSCYPKRKKFIAKKA